jgi:hypothetical protein
LLGEFVPAPSMPRAGQARRRALGRGLASTDSHPWRPRESGRSVPSAWITARTGKLSSRHQVTSVMSPNVQIIAMPLPSRDRPACAHEPARARRTAA